MAQQRDEKKVLFTMKASPSERAQIHAAAKARGVSASELVREGLRLQGALPK
jgi:hypothetical protein